MDNSSNFTLIVCETKGGLLQHSQSVFGISQPAHQSSNQGPTETHQQTETSPSVVVKQSRFSTGWQYRFECCWCASSMSNEGFSGFVRNERNERKRSLFSICNLIQMCLVQRETLRHSTANSIADTATALGYSNSPQQPVVQQTGNTQHLGVNHYFTIEHGGNNISVIWAGSKHYVLFLSPPSVDIPYNSAFTELLFVQEYSPWNPHNLSLG